MAKKLTAKAKGNSIKALEAELTKARRTALRRLKKLEEVGITKYVPDWRQMIKNTFSTSLEKGYRAVSTARQVREDEGYNTNQYKDYLKGKIENFNQFNKVKVKDVTKLQKNGLDKNRAATMKTLSRYFGILSINEEDLDIYQDILGSAFSLGKDELIGLTSDDVIDIIKELNIDMDEFGILFKKKGNKYVLEELFMAYKNSSVSLKEAKKGLKKTKASKALELFKLSL